MNREEIISLVTRISELRQEVSRLSGLQKELRALEAKLDGIADSPAPLTSRDSNSMVERAIAVVDGDRTKEWTAEEAAVLLGAKVPSIRAAFSKAVAMSRIVRCGRGRFRSNSQPAQAEAESVEGHGIRAA
jgi:hypothetical protein